MTAEGKNLNVKKERNMKKLLLLTVLIIFPLSLYSQGKLRIGYSPIQKGTYSDKNFFTADGKFLISLDKLTLMDEYSRIYIWDVESGRFLLSRSTEDLGSMYEVEGFIPDYKNDLLYLQMPGGGVRDKAINMKTLEVASLPSNVKIIIEEYKRKIPKPLKHPHSDSVKLTKELLRDEYYVSHFVPSRPIAVVRNLNAGVKLFNYEKKTTIDVPFNFATNADAEKILFSPTQSIAVVDVGIGRVAWNWETGQKYYLMVRKDLISSIEELEQFNLNNNLYYERSGTKVYDTRYIFGEPQADISSEYGIAIVHKSGAGNIGIFDLKSLELKALLRPEDYLLKFNKKDEPIFCEIIHIRAINEQFSLAVLQYRIKASQVDRGKPHACEIVKINNKTGKIEGRLLLPKDPRMEDFKVPYFNVPNFPKYRFDLTMSNAPYFTVSFLGDKMLKIPNTIYIIDVSSLKIAKKLSGELITLDSLLYYYDEMNIYLLNPETSQQQILYTVPKERKLTKVSISDDRKRIAYAFPYGKSDPKIGIYEPPDAYVIADIQTKQDSIIKPGPGKLYSSSLWPYISKNGQVGFLVKDPLRRMIDEWKYSWNAKEYLVSSTERSEIYINSTSSKDTVIARSDSRPLGIKNNGIQFRGPLVLWFGRNGNLKFYDLENRFLYDFIVSRYADQFVIVREDGYYCGSTEMLRNYYIIDGFKTYGLEQYDASLNRPDIIYKALPFSQATFLSLLEKIVSVRQKMLAVSSTYNITQVDEIVVRELNVKTQPNGDVAEITVAPAEGSNPPVLIHAFADGVPVFGKKGLKFQPNTDNKMNISVPLLFGDNKIEISGIDRNGNESRRLEFVVRSGTKPKNAKLIGIHIGVSTFKDSTFNLTYAAKDAEDLSKQFNLSGYESEKIVLTNEQVTIENISKLKQKLLATSVHDVVLISVASHGVLDSTLNYYIATHDMDFMNSAVRGIPYSLLEDLLDGIPARRKVLLIDACNSGENLNIAEPSEKEKSLQKNTTEQGVRARGFKKAQDASSSFTQNNVRRLFELLFPEVRRGTGAIVVSASGAQEFAFESAQWKNGVFTYAVLQGIQTMQADLNKDRKLMMRELKEYVYRKVQDLTNGMQNPTSRLDNIRLDIEVK